MNTGADGRTRRTRNLRERRERTASEWGPEDHAECALTAPSEVPFAYFAFGCPLPPPLPPYCGCLNSAATLRLVLMLAETRLVAGLAPPSQAGFTSPSGAS